MLTPLAQLNRLHTCGSIMAEKLDPTELVTLEELAISTMWETSALVEVLKRKRILARQEIYDAINDLRRHHEATILTNRSVSSRPSGTKLVKALPDLVSHKRTGAFKGHQITGAMCLLCFSGDQANSPPHCSLTEHALHWSI